MFYLCFTTPAKERKHRKRPQTGPTPTRLQAFYTWFLVVVWAGLMGFGVVSMAEPSWMQEWAKPGIDSESSNYKNYGDAALRDRKYSLAIAQYVRALEIKPDATNVKVNLATTCIRMKRVDEGLRLLNDALDENPHTQLKSAIYYNLGEAYEALGDTERALQYFQAAVDHHIRPDRGYWKIGRMYLAAGRLQEARQALEKALAAQLDPALTYREMLMRSMGEYERRPEHLAVLEQTLKQDIDVDTLRPYDLALIRQLQQRNPEVAHMHNQLGVVCGRLRDYAGAIEHFEASLCVVPDNEGAVQGLAQARQMSGS